VGQWASELVGQQQQYACFLLVPVTAVWAVLMLLRQATVASCF
jgi:hypothetical protein